MRIHGASGCDRWERYTDGRKSSHSPWLEPSMAHLEDGTADDLCQRERVTGSGKGSEYSECIGRILKQSTYRCIG